MVKLAADIHGGSFKRRWTFSHYDERPRSGVNRAAYVWKTCWRPHWKPRRKGDKQARWTAQWTLWRRDVSGPPMAQCLTHEDIVAPRLF
jgi:hypothetical protein